MNNLSTKAFNDFFKNKGNTAPIAEKSNRNFNLKFSKQNNTTQLFYFGIGHVFKQLDNKSIFKYTTNESTGNTEINRFKNLRNEIFTNEFAEKLNEILGNIRDINSHYVHDFAKINLENIDDGILDFLKEAFELAVIHIYLREQDNKISFSEFDEDAEQDKKIVNFLCDKFYPFNMPDKKEKLSEEALQVIENKKQFIKEFKTKTKKEAINHILFIDNTENIEWKLYETHKVLDIPKGKYLSFHGSLFLLSMFLYKGEANQLISKIKGFKRNDDNKYKSKRNLFSFYSKRFSSQDIDSENNNFIKFRDIVQYLNHYPKAWNSELELDTKIPQMTKILKEKIINAEIERCYPKYKGKDRFLIFAKLKIWGRKHLGKTIENQYISQNYTEQEITNFNYEIYRTKEYKDAKNKLIEERKKETKLNNKGTSNLSYNDKKTLDRIERNISKNNKILKKEENKINTDTEKLEIRIAKNLLYMQYGRNQDRFMEFAVRFLAENNYFGKNAEFKLYKHYNSKEQEEDLIVLKKEKSKKEFDKLKFHQGKLVYYSTFDNHLSKYPSWDMPFVIENNSVKVKIEFEYPNPNEDNITKTVIINRKSLIYFLELAFYGNQPIENEGKALLAFYYKYGYLKDFEEKLKILEKKDSLTKEEKTEFKKLFPKRLLHKYSEAINNGNNNVSSLQLLLDSAKKSEKRYKALLDKVKKEEEKYKNNFPNEDVRLVEYFIKKNKGKQFKLKFVRKACNIMYFRNTYFEQKDNVNKHHKRFHINKEEYNNFSKWMFAFDEVPIYKKLLNKLFEDKGFYKNSEFKSLFGISNTLDELYLSTKELYTEWLKSNNSQKKDEISYQLANYKELFADKTFLINTSHFVKYFEGKGFLKRDEEQRLIYQSLENEKFLIQEYYYKSKLDKKHWKTCGKLFTKLRKNKLEDALLYKIAMNYLNTDKTTVQETSTKITELQTQDVKFDIPDKEGNHLFYLTVPFNKLMQYQELKEQKQIEEKDRDSFLSNMIAYLEKIKNDKDIKGIYKEYNNNSKTLKFEDLYKINNHLINNSSKFTKVELELEKYFVATKEISIGKDNRIIYDEIADLSQYFNKVTRNKAFHFGVPIDSYSNILKQIERKFIENEIMQNIPASFDDLSIELRSVCNIFLEKIHHDFYKGENWDIKFKQAKERYFNEIIS